ncbi:MAG: cyclase family protein [Solirubrobacteraceae bacterium]
MPHIVDLSQEIYQGMPVYAGHLETKVWQHHRHEDTAANFDSEFSYQSLGLTVCDHGPTHVDAISHLDPRAGALRIDEMPLDTFWGEGIALDISDLGTREYCTAQRLDRALADSPVALRPGDVLLLRTGAADRHEGTTEYATEYGGLDQSAADWLRDHRPKIFGVDSPSPDAPGDRIYPVHLYCRQSGVTHYENLTNLGAVLGRRFQFYGFPLRVRGGHGSPVRALAMVDD